MQIMPISNSVSRNNNTNFDGSMHKSVEKAVKRLEIEQIKNLIQEYNGKGRTITNGTIYALKTRAKECLEKLAKIEQERELAKQDFDKLTNNINFFTNV